MQKTIPAVALLLAVVLLFAACMAPVTVPTVTSQSTAGSTQSSTAQTGSSAADESQPTASTAVTTNATTPTQAPATTQSTSATAPSTSSYRNMDFTASEKRLFQSILGIVIPFSANDEYYVEEYSYDGEVGLNFYTFGNTRTEYLRYCDSFGTYQVCDSYMDEYGDTWLCFLKGEVYVDLCYYETEMGWCLDVYAYILTDNGGSGGGSTVDADLLTNDGIGLPTGTNGVYKVDLTKGRYVKDVTDQGYYLDGCPTVGNPAVLVIPVDFSDATAQSMGYDISVLKNAFCKDGTTDYHSVYDYYYTSSYGQLRLDITVLDFWFRPQYSSSYYENATIYYEGETTDIGDQMILDEALAYLEGIMDLSEFDSDNNGFIDSVVLINALDVGDDDFHWAYRYWNIYTDGRDELYSYDGVSANDYLWASYQFLYERSDDRGNVSYDNASGVNTYTYIHEFGHILGADDYYDTTGSAEPMGGCDIMDAMAGDHNAFTKFNLGWLTSSRLVTTDSSVTLTLEAFAKNGDTVILANNWDPELGAYQEYYILAYYRNTGLNSGAGGYFLRDGIVVYHVNASLYKEVLDGEAYYDIHNNNSSPDSTGYGTDENLIEYVLSDAGNYTYAAGDSLSSVIDDSGNELGYSFAVDALDGDTATVTFIKK